MTENGQVGFIQLNGRENSQREEEAKNNNNNRHGRGEQEENVFLSNTNK